MAINVGDGKITINTDDKASAKLAKIGRNAKAMGQQFKKAGMVMVAAGLAIAGALAATVISYAKAGDEVAKMAKRTGLAVEMLSELRHVAGLTGAGLESIEKAVKKMSKTIVDATDGLSTYVRAFDKIGLSADELIKLSPEDQFWAIAEAIGALESPTLRAAVAQEIFGRAGTALLPMMAESAESLALMRQEAHDLGIVFDEEAALKAELFTDASQRLKESLQGVGFALADQLMPAITDFLENKVIPTIIEIKDWVDANEDLARTLVKVSGVLIAGGALLLGLALVARAITAISAALVVLHALSGPAGWIKLAAGIALAGGALFAINKLTNQAVNDLMPELPSLARGGIVPGTLGQPVPIIAHGGEAFGGVGGKLGSTFNVSIGNFMGDESSLREFARTIKELEGQDNRRTSFAGINRAGYFQGSSAP